MAEVNIDVAKQATSEVILAKLGSEDDSGATLSSGSITGKLNALMAIIGSGSAEYTTSGTYTLELPSGIRKIYVTACGGGGGGAGGYSTSNNTICYIGGGGGGGASVADKLFTLTENTTLQITVGAGGSRLQQGTDGDRAGSGGATIIGNLLTLAGGQGGELLVRNKTGSTPSLPSGGASGGTGGGAGGSGIFGPTDITKADDGESGLIGEGGLGGYKDATSTYTGAGSGGGGSIGAGGAGGASWYNGVAEYINATAGVRGGGGGGGGYKSLSASAGPTCTSANGGSGYVKIVWGL